MRRKKWRWWLLGLGILLLVFILAAEFTSRSSFCSVCHYMKPFYESWKTSSHHEIECHVCHYPPGLRSKLRAKVEGLLQVGRYWTKLYIKSKPWAEIPDEACLRPGCHDKRLLEGMVKFKTVVFDHKVHFEDLRRGKKLRCTSCHSQIVQGEHITVTESSCFICHFKQSEHYPRIADCSHCHKPEDLTANKERYDHRVALQSNLPCQRCHVQVIVGDGIVPRENCYKCHFEKDRLDQYEETDLIHSTHIAAHKIECNQCHLEIQHKILKDIEAMANCQTCHYNFHEAQKILYQGKGGEGLTHAMPSIKMEKGLSCQGCHVLHEETGSKFLSSETLKASGEACESCHGKGFSSLLAQWKKAAEKEISEAKQILQRAQQELARGQTGQKEEAQRLLEEAAFNIALVEKGKAVHNMVYSTELLAASSHLIAKAMQLIGSNFQPPPMKMAPGRAPTSCLNCHQGIEAISPRIFGLTFNHEVHLQKTDLDCQACHSLSPQHGKLIMTKNGCASCHHQAGVEDCTSCHQVQAHFYQGGKLFPIEVKQDSMAEAGVECQQCHPFQKGKISRFEKTSCLECHEPNDLQVFTRKQKEVQVKLEDLQLLLAELKKLSLNPEEKTALEEDLKILEVMMDEGSSGAHNLSFYQAWLSDRWTKWSSIEKEKKEKR